MVQFERSVPTHIASQIIAFICKSLTPSGVRIAIQIAVQIIAFIWCSGNGPNGYTVVYLNKNKIQSLCDNLHVCFVA